MSRPSRDQKSSLHQLPAQERIYTSELSQELSWTITSPLYSFRKRSLMLLWSSLLPWKRNSPAPNTFLPKLFKFWLLLLGKECYLFMNRRTFSFIIQRKKLLRECTYLIIQRKWGKLGGWRIPENRWLQFQTNYVMRERLILGLGVFSK